MITKYRLVKYEAETQEAIDRQISHSLAPNRGFFYGNNVTITVTELSTDVNDILVRSKTQNRKFYDALVLLAGEYELAGNTNHPEYLKIKKVLAESDEEART